MDVTMETPQFNFSAKPEIPQVAPYEEALNPDLLNKQLIRINFQPGCFQVE